MAKNGAKKMKRSDDEKLVFLSKVFCIFCLNLVNTIYKNGGKYMEETVKELHKVLEFFDEARDVLDDIEDVNLMIMKNRYTKEKIIKIESKYSVETNFLMKFENSEKIGFKNNYEDPDLQVLLNLRNRLYIIAIYKVLKEQGKEIPKGFLNKNYSELMNLITK